jgi:general secretion pathway protein M
MSQLMETVSAFWLERNGRERAVLTLVALLLLLGLIYAALIGPALSGRAELEKSLPILRQQSAELQGLAKQAMELANSGAPPVPLSKESIEIALGRRGLKAQNVVQNGDMVKVQLAAASFVGMLDWLDEMQKTARLSVLDANIVALPAVDSVNATLTLKQQRTEE